jgi:uncharacterized protein (DUF305 family)
MDLVWMYSIILTRELPMTQARLFPISALAFAAIAAAGCERAQRESVSTTAAGDTTAGYGTTATPPGAVIVANRDTPEFSTTRTPSETADQDFLRLMIDHHEGLIELASTVTGLRDSTVENEARALRDRQQAEQNKLIALARRVANDSVKPNVTTWGKGLAGTLKGLAGVVYTKKFYEQVVAHHKEGIRIIDEMTPNLRNAEVSAIAKKMKSDAQKEIARFEKKAAAAD